METPQGCSIILRLHYHNVCDSVGVLYMHQRGAFGVVLSLYQRCTLKDDISYLLPT